MRTYYQLGRLYSELEDDEKAATFYKKAIQIRPNLSQALVNLASIYDRQGKTELADRSMMEALKADPGSPFVNLNLGIYFLRAGKPEAAIGPLALSNQERGLRKRAFQFLGIAYKQVGVYGRAASFFRESLKLDPKGITPHLHLIEIFARTGHRAESEREARFIAGLIEEDEDLFEIIINLVKNRGHLGHVALSADLILPLLSKVSHDKSEQTDGRSENTGSLLPDSSRGAY